MKKIRDLKLSVKLILGGVVAVLISLIIVGSIAVNTASDALVSSGEQSAFRVAQDLAMTAEIFLDEEMKFAKEMSMTPVLTRAVAAVAEKGRDDAMDAIRDLDKFLARAYASLGGAYGSFFVADPNGNILSSDKGQEMWEKGINVKDRDYFIAGKAGKAVVSKPVKSRASGLPVVMMTIPLKDGSGQFAGVFAVILKLDALSSKLTNVKIGETGYPFMADPQGIIIAHPKEEYILKLDLKTLNGMEEITRRMMAGESGIERYVFKGTKKVAGFAHIARTGWSICVTQNVDEFMAPVRKMKMFIGIAGLIVLAVVGVLIFFIALAIIRPINEAVKGLKDISEGEGDLTKRLAVSGGDEVGILSLAFNTFIEKLQSMISDITEGVETLSSSSTELATISDEMTRGSEQTSEKAATVAAAAEEMTTNMNSVSAAMEQSSTNVNTVASAAEEMSSTINEIARNAEKARDISSNAVAKVEQSTEKMNELGTAAEGIGQVVETITEISEQVNLLSLNATIEAARAGEAGKGFAVVANEIKDLAGQTSDASMDIKSRIANIQESTSGSLAGMAEISQVIDEVNEIVATIAAAVEEQSSATMEISQNISQASTGIEDVNQNVSESSTVAHEITMEISEVNQAASEMADRSTQVQASAQDLSRLAAQLDGLVGRFKI